MKRIVRYALGAGTIALLLIAVALLACASHRSRQMTACTDVSVEILDDFQFVSAEEVKGYLDSDYGIYLGQRIDSVGLADIEKMLDRQSAILKSEAWVTSDGILHISITQREPVLRLRKGDDCFYVDKTGFIFPVQGEIHSGAPLVEGNIPLNIAGKFKGEPGSEDEKKWVRGMTEFVSWMKKAQWSDRIGAISVDRNGDLLLKRADGKETFIFGTPDHFREKFDRMDNYIRHILTEKGEGYYRSVNVKYAGQIICRQK